MKNSSHLFTSIIRPSQNQGHPKGERAIIPSASVVMITLLVISESRTAAKEEKFSHCDKNATKQADLAACAANDLKRADDELNAIYQQLIKKAAGDAIALNKLRQHREQG